MKLQTLITLIALNTLLSVLTTEAQTTVTGTVKTMETSAPLAFANVTVKNEQIGTTTDKSGKFSIVLEKGIKTILITSFGYKAQEIMLNISGTNRRDLGEIFLETEPINIKEITVSSSHTNDDIEFITKSTIKMSDVEQFVSNKTYPELIRSVPGVFATSDAGNYGDAKLNMRGFKQENITVMLNGIPLTGFLTGSMFWNNWVGLTQATYSIQVQKGIGASNLSANSLGGTINIITKPAELNKAASISYSNTDYGNRMLNVNLSSGVNEKGWAVGFTGSHTNGQGYVDATHVNSFAYMLNVSKRINSKHSMLLTVIGAPERHGQRSTRLSYEDVKKYGVRYNKDWGERDGEIVNLSENFYHKPFASLNHYYYANEDLFFSTSLYVSSGTGGGLWNEAKDGHSISTFRTHGGQIDWNEVYAYNLSDSAGEGRNIRSNFFAGHTWAGIKPQVNWSVNENIKVTAGVHYQYYYSWQNEQIIDLLGSDYWFEDYAKNSLAGLAGRNTMKQVGDYIRLDNGNTHNHTSLFVENKYDNGNTSAFLSGLFMLNAYQRWDKYNYVDNIKSNVVFAFGGNIKAGAGYKITESHTVYVNGGWNSRVPYPSFYFPNSTNDINHNIRNEQAYMFEGGYTFGRYGTKINLNGYYNYWKDKSLMSDRKKQNNEDLPRYMISGLDAQHFGGELAIERRLNSWLNLSAFASVGDWRWMNDVNAVITDEYTNQPIDTVHVFSKNLYVGDAPQTQMGITADVKLLKSFSVRGEWRYNARMYADFDPSRRNNANDRAQSYRVPSYSVFDLHAGYDIQLSHCNINFYASVNNLFDKFYIERGTDGVTHNLDSFSGYWGFGRTFSFGVKVTILN